MLSVCVCMCSHIILLHALDSIIVSSLSCPCLWPLCWSFTSQRTGAKSSPIEHKRSELRGSGRKPFPRICNVIRSFQRWRKLFSCFRHRPFLTQANYSGIAYTKRVIYWKKLGAYCNAPKNNYFRNMILFVPCIVTIITNIHQKCTQLI